jgi:hypothetical protein
MMPTAESEQNKATAKQFCEAMNTNDAELSSRAIDDFVEPDALIRTPLPLPVAGSQALKEGFATLHRAYPTFISRSRI